MNSLDIPLKPGQQIYFASDFHLGAPSSSESLNRERKIIRWLDSISMNAEALFLVGDIFDFWFEYKHVIPKGFIRFQGKLAELRDRDIPIYLFLGNHDMWMFRYFQDELGIPVYGEPIILNSNGKRIQIGHGDGLGPGDHQYKILKKIFRNRIAQWGFQWLHPNIGMALAHAWSSRSRITNESKDEEFKNDDEWLFRYCKATEKINHYDFYIFGHRHLPIEMKVNDDSHYINLGEWVNHYTYAAFDGKKVQLEKFED